MGVEARILTRQEVIADSADKYLKTLLSMVPKDVESTVRLGKLVSLKVLLHDVEYRSDRILIGTVKFSIVASVNGANYALQTMATGGIDQIPTSIAAAALSLGWSWEGIHLPGTLP